MKIVLAGTAAPLLHLLAQIPSGSAAGVFVDGGGEELLAAEATRAKVRIEPASHLTPARLRELAPDWLLAVAFGEILSPEVLALPTQGCLNAHPGMLPEYAGLDVHRWAILNGEKEFGAVVHWMEPEIDAGPLISQQRFPIESEDTGLSLYHTSCRVAVKLMSRAIDDISSGKALAKEPQDRSLRKVYRRITDMTIDWMQPAAKVRDFVRAMASPGGGARATLSGKQVTVRNARLVGRGTGAPGTVVRRDGELCVVCGDGELVALTEVS